MLIRGNRISLREFNTTDSKSMFLLNSDPEVLKYTGDPPFESESHAKAFLENYNHSKEHGFGRWAVVLNNTNAFIGWCGLKQHQDYVDLGFRFFREEWNKGYATESASLSLKYAFEILELPSIVGRVAQDNLASKRVLEKLGFTYWKQDNCEGIENALHYKLNKKDYFILKQAD